MSRAHKSLLVRNPIYLLFVIFTSNDLKKREMTNPNWIVFAIAIEAVFLLFFVSMDASCLLLFFIYLIL